jgi:hypothetical protein
MGHQINRQVESNGSNKQGLCPKPQQGLSSLHPDVALPRKEKKNPFPGKATKANLLNFSCYQPEMAV